MDSKEFAAELTAALNLEGVVLAPDTVLRDVPGWDSLALLLAIAFADERFGKALSERQIAAAVTVEGLWKHLSEAGE